jgi:hypothetical protein
MVYAFRQMPWTNEIELHLRVFWLASIILAETLAVFCFTAVTREYAEPSYGRTYARQLCSSSSADFPPPAASPRRKQLCLMAAHSGCPISIAYVKAGVSVSLVTSKAYALAPAH